jgi:hypothetical protein
MATRRRYKSKAERLHYRDGGAVPPSNIIDANAQVPETLPTPPPVEPIDHHDHDAVRRAAEATRLADEYRRNPQTLIDQFVDQMPGLSEHKRSFLKANPLLLNQDILPIAGRAWQQGLAQGIPDDSERINQHILQAVRQGIEAQRQMPPAVGPVLPPPRMPAMAPGGAYDREEVERLQAEAADHLAEMRPAPLPPIATQRRSLPVSAPVSRDIPLPSGKKLSQETQITLNPEERDIAHKSYSWLRKADAEREYATQKLKLASLRKAGVYPEADRN